MSTGSELELFTKDNRTRLRKDSDVLDTGYSKNKLRFRDNELKLLKKFSHIYVDENTAFDIEIIGECFVGKTRLIKELTKYLKHFEDLKVIKIRWSLSLNGFLKRIYEELTGTKLENTLYGTTFKGKIKEFLAENPTKLIFIFEDLDSWGSHKKLNQIFDYLYNDYFFNFNCLISILRIRSLEKVPLRCEPNDNFINEQITLKKYSLNQIKTILLDKIEIGFQPNVITDDCIAKLAEWSADTNQNLFLGCHVLDSAVWRAELERSDRITYKYLKRSYCEIIKRFSY